MQPASTARPPVQIQQVAKSFYGMLTTEGFTHAQIVHLANDLLALVQTDLRATPEPSAQR
jgi:hypothetical protein